MPVSVRSIGPDNAAVIAQLTAWQEAANTEPVERGATHCAALVAAVKRENPNAHNFGVFEAERLVGGVATTSEYLDVMWLHWDSTRQGIGPAALHQIIALQLRKHTSVIVLNPNLSLCKALLKIMTPARRARARVDESVTRVTFRRGDLRIQ